MIKYQSLNNENLFKMRLYQMKCSLENWVIE